MTYIDMYEYVGDIDDYRSSIQHAVTDSHYMYNEHEY